MFSLLTFAVLTLAIVNVNGSAIDLSVVRRNVLVSPSCWQHKDLPDIFYLNKYNAPYHVANMQQFKPLCKDWTVDGGKIQPCKGSDIATECFSITGQSQIMAVTTKSTICHVTDMSQFAQLCNSQSKVLQMTTNMMVQEVGQGEVDAMFPQPVTDAFSTLRGIVNRIDEHMNGVKPNQNGWQKKPKNLIKKWPH